MAEIWTRLEYIPQKYKLKEILNLIDIYLWQTSFKISAIEKMLAGPLFNEFLKTVGFMN